MKLVDEKELWFNKACILQMQANTPLDIEELDLQEAVTGCAGMSSLLANRFLNIFEEEVGIVWTLNTSVEDFRLIYVQFCLEKAKL
jgi:hypothetical protein